MVHFVLENGVYLPREHGNIICRLMHTDWCIMAHSNIDVRLAWVSPWGLVFADTGAKFPRTPLALVEVDGAICAEIGDFYIYRCACPDLTVAAHTVAERIRSQLMPHWKPYLTDNSLYGESLTFFPGFRILGGPVTLAPDWRHIGAESIADDPRRSVAA